MGEYLEPVGDIGEEEGQGMDVDQQAGAEDREDIKYELPSRASQDVVTDKHCFLRPV